jgi:hypothetical protein
MVQRSLCEPNPQSAVAIELVGLRGIAIPDSEIQSALRNPQSAIELVGLRGIAIPDSEIQSAIRNPQSAISRRFVTRLSSPNPYPQRVQILCRIGSCRFGCNERSRNETDSVLVVPTPGGAGAMVALNA